MNQNPDAVIPQQEKPTRFQGEFWIAHEDKVHHCRHDKRTNQDVVVHIPRMVMEALLGSRLRDLA